MSEQERHPRDLINSSVSVNTEERRNGKGHHGNGYRVELDGLRERPPTTMRTNIQLFLIACTLVLAAVIFMRFMAWALGLV